MNPELSKTYLASFAPDQPIPRTSTEAGQGDKPRRNVETTESPSAESSLRSSAPAGPNPKLYCDICQSSSFETLEDKAMAWTPRGLEVYKLRHRKDSETFRTWLRFHHINVTHRKCPVCLNNCSGRLGLQLHLLEQHHDDVPTKLPGDIFRFAYRLCLNWSISRKVALKYQSMVEQLEGDSAPAPRRKALADIREGDSYGVDGREQGNKKTRKLEDVES